MHQKLLDLTPSILDRFPLNFFDIFHTSVHGMCILKEKIQTKIPPPNKNKHTLTMKKGCPVVRSQAGAWTTSNTQVELN